MSESETVMNRADGVVQGALLVSLYTFFPDAVAVLFQKMELRTVFFVELQTRKAPPLPAVAWLSAKVSLVKETLPEN